MKNELNRRLTSVREVMGREHLGAFLFSDSDPHHSKRVAGHWKSMEWVSGYKGAVGIAAVTMHKSALWTDSAHLREAADQLKENGYEVMTMNGGMTELAQWLGRELAFSSDSASTEVGLDGNVWAAADVDALSAELRRHGGMTLRTNMDVVRDVWTGRPEMPMGKIELVLSELSAAEKIVLVRKSLRQVHADGMLVTVLDEIGWTLNLRGTDVEGCDVFEGYLLIDSRHASLFVDSRKLTPAVCEYLRCNHVAVAEYTDVKKGLKDYFEYNILMDPSEVPYALYKVVERPVVAAPSPVSVLRKG